MERFRIASRARGSRSVRAFTVQGSMPVGQGTVPRPPQEWWSGTLADQFHSKSASWKADRARHAVFWEFIENERNQVLKQYELGFLPGTVAVAVDGEVFQLGDTLFSPMSAGPYAWEDCRDVLAEAVEWWQVQLNQVEAMMVSA